MLRKIRQIAQLKWALAAAGQGAIALAATLVLAQTGGFDVSWQSTSTVGATATSSGGGFELQGVIGQPGAGTSGE